MIQCLEFYAPEASGLIEFRQRSIQNGAKQIETNIRFILHHSRNLEVLIGIDSS